ncbi:MAG: STAS domain-containing protein [Kofleriaceae bacterium]|nr:STAS domain-containing protein [Myxococcales bacterium]MCB9561114.1 STAS domain-containing protein [Kofleriaceae bacterium]
MQFQRTDQGDESTLRIAGSLDVLTAPELMPTIDQLVEEKRPRVTVDLSGLDIIDSSGVAVLVALYKRVRAVGGHVTVAGARDQPLAIFKLLRMDKVFSI